MPSLSAPRKVLIVEDELLIAMDLRGRLKDLGYEVLAIADTAEKAFNLAASCDPDLILMDIRLGGGSDGIEAAVAVRQCLDIPVIFLTSHADTQTLERAKLSDPFGYIVKPFGSIDFRATIEIALNKHETESGLRRSLRWQTAQGKSRLLRLFRDYSPDVDSDACESQPDPPKGRLAYEEAILEAIPDAGILVDHKGNVLIVNALAARLFGYRKDELAGKQVQILFAEQCEWSRMKDGDPDGDFPRSDAGTPSMTDENQSMTGLVCSCLHRNGHEFSVALSLSVVPAAEGQLVLSLFRDLSERIPSMGKPSEESGFNLPRYVHEKVPAPCSSPQADVVRPSGVA